MKLNRSWGILALIVAALGIAAAFTRSSGVFTVFLGAALCLALSVLIAHLSQSPSLVARMQASRWWFIVGGVAFAVVGFAASVTVAMRTDGDSEWATAIGAVVLLAGLLVAMLPRMAAQTYTATAEINALKERPAPSGRFDGRGESLYAWTFLVKDWALFAAMAGPWILVSSGMFYAFAKAGLAAKTHSGDAMPSLLLLVLAISVLLTAVPTVFVAWSRWTISGKQPRFGVALPNRATWSVAWRLWLVSSILKTPEDFVASGLTKALGTGPMAEALSDVAIGAVDIALLAIFSAMALRLTALAVQNSKLSASVLQVEGRKLWPGLPIGLVIAVAPPYALMSGIGWLLQPLGHNEANAANLASPAGLLIFTASFLLTFVAVASAATLLGRAYQRVLERIG